MKPKPGDILLVVPLKRPLRMPKFTLSSLFGLGATLTWNAAHVAIYTGKVVEQTLAHGLHSIGFDEFIKDLSRNYAQFWIYIVRPKHARGKKQKLLQVLKPYETLRMPYHLAHAIKIKLFDMINKLTTWGRSIAEPFYLVKAICSTFVAFVLKQAGIDIGKRSSLAFTPGTFLKSKKFKTVKRTLYTEGKAVRQVKSQKKRS